MSSHHIIRDRQEPALLVLSMKNIPFELLGNLLEWSPTVICTEGTVWDVLSNGIKVDAIIVTGSDPERVAQAQELQAPLEEIYCKSGMEMQAAMDWLRNKKHEAVNLLMDENQLNQVMESIFRLGSIMDLVIFDGKSKHLVLNKPVFKKWVSAGQQFRVDAIGKSIKLRTNGFTEKVDGEKMTPFTLITHHSGMVTIEPGILPILVSEIFKV